MRITRFMLGVLVFSALSAAGARGEAPPDPLRLVPADTDVLLVVPQPRQAIEMGLRLQAFEQARQLEPVAEFYKSNGYRRFRQLLAYFEKELGAKWPDLLDRLAGGGIAVGIHFAPDPAPALLVIQGKDEKTEKRFFDLALQVLEQADEEEGKNKPQKKKYRDIETIVGPEFQFAVAGSAIVVSNKEETLNRALDLYLDGSEKSLAKAASVHDAWKLLPADCLARLWLNMEAVRQRPEAKPFFTSPPGDPAQTVLFGGMLDVGRRSACLCAGLYRKDDDFTLTVRMPAGREGMAEFMSVHIPPMGKPGSRALIEPRNAIFSSSFHLDLPGFWEKRNQLLPPDAVKGLADADKNIGKFLPGAKLGTLLPQAGAYHRFVVVQQDDFGYKKRPKQPQPAFALVTELTDPEPFAKSMNTILRGAALAAGSRFKLKLIEEKHGDRQIVGYRASETAKVPDDPDGARFSFSPSFVLVGNQFVVSSTIELAHEIVDLLEKEAASEPKADSPASVRSRLYSRGGAAFARNFEEVLITQAVLNQALSHDDARRQVQALFAWIEKLGNIDTDSGYDERTWHHDFTIKLK
jgi:hypothetical protein